MGIQLGNKVDISRFPTPAQMDEMKNKKVDISRFPTPTQMRVKSGELPVEVTGPRSALMGAAQGATFGLADEAIGGVGVLGEAIQRALQGKGALDPELAGVYEQKRDQARHEFEQAQEENPVMYGAGEMGAAFIPGVGSLAAGKELATGASLAEKAIEGAKTGAKLGGLAGFGYSTAKTPEDIAKDTITGAGMGMGIGGGAPLVGAAGKAGADKLTDIIGEYGGTAGKAFKAGTKGVNLLTEEKASEAYSKAIKGPAKEIQDKLFSTLDDNFKQKMAILKDKGSSPVNFDKLYQETVDLIDSKVGSGLGIDEAEQMKKAFGYKFLKELPEEYKGIGYKRVVESYKPGEEGVMRINKTTQESQDPQLPPNAKTKNLNEFKIQTRNAEPGIKQEYNAAGKLTGQTITSEQQIDAIKDAVTKGDISPEEGLKFVQDLQHAGFEKNMSDPTKSGIFKDVARKASDIVEGVNPEKLSPLNKQSSSIYDVLDQLNLSPKEKEYVSKNLMSNIRDYGDKFNPAQEEKSRQLMDSLKKAFPEDAAKWEQQIKEGADLGRVAEKLGGTEIHTSTSNPKNVAIAKAGGLGGLIGKASNAAGLVTGGTSEGIINAIKPGYKSGLGAITAQAMIGSEVEKDDKQRSAEIQRKAFNASDEDLNNYAQKIQNLDANISKQLIDAVQSGDSAKKNRLLFNILQKPNLRSAFAD
jgi:polyhydroxyalkanoate synthesis regulator phasin